jgi:hypothetical protein
MIVTFQHVAAETATYQCWSVKVPTEYIEAASSFAARIEFAKKHKLVVTECMARKLNHSRI